jgi:hypothetical protein
MLKLSPITILLLFGMLGCKSVQPSDLAGTWTMKDVLRKGLPAELQNGSGKIVLNADGSFVASELPGLFFIQGRHAAQLDGGNGVWKLVSREGRQQVQLEFQLIPGWKGLLPYGTQLEVGRGSLFYFVGDADEGRRIVFEKK